MSLTAAESGFVVFFLSVQVIQGQRDWGVTYNSTEICALGGSTVNLDCSYRYPSRINHLDTKVNETLWFTKLNGSEPVDLRTDSQYSERVQSRCSENSCTLTITDLRESDSAEYKFKFITNQPDGGHTGSPGVTLTVTDLQVMVMVSIFSNWADLKCHSSCHLPDHLSYVWYKNGQKIQTQTSSSYSGYFNHRDSYSCAVEGREDFSSPPVCVRGQTCNRVTYDDRSICAFKGSSLDISCSYNSYSGFDSIKSKFWFSPERSHQWQSPSQPEDLNEDSQYADRVQVLDTERGRSTLRITDLRESDSAEYKFRFITNQPVGGHTGSPGVTLTVTDLQVKVSRSGYRADLKCHSSCHLPDHLSYVWYKNGQKIQTQTSSSYSVNFYSENSYSCAVEGREDFSSPPVCVRDRTCNRVTYDDRSICAFKGSSLDISCTYSSFYSIKSKVWFSPERSHQWQSPSQPEDLSEDSQYAGRVQVLETERGRSTLRITDLRESDSAEYHFKFKTPWFEWRSSLPGTTLTVTALQVQVTRITFSQYHTEAELKCHSSCSPAARLSYVWFRNGQKITNVETSSYKVNYNPEDNISCALKGHEDLTSPPVYGPKLPSVSLSPSGEIVEGSSVTLTCSSDANPAATYTWYKTNGDPDLHPVSKEPQLVFSSIQFSDSGEYYCTAENELRRRTSENISVDVKYGPKLPSVSVSPSGEIVEGSSVTLTCSSDAIPAATYTWYKENQKVLQGPTGAYHFISISSEDRGNYHCKSENQYGQINSSSVSIDVQYGPKLPSVSVSPSGEIVEGSSVTLTCSSDANPAATYTWYKVNEDSPKASGQNFTITDFRAEHRGNYSCEAQNRVGRHNSTLQAVSPLRNSPPIVNIIKLTLVVVMPIPLLLFCLWMRKKKTLSSTTEPNEPIEALELESDPDYNISALNSVPAAQTEDTEVQEHLV